MLPNRSKNRCWGATELVAPVVVASVVVASVACGSVGSDGQAKRDENGERQDSGQESGQGEPADGGAEGAAPSCAATHFGAAQKFSFPPQIDGRYAGDPLPLAFGNGACAGNPGDTYRFVTMELTGDHKPDLVMQRDQCASSAVGRSSWTLFSNLGTGLAAPIVFSFPAAIDGRFVEYSGYIGASCGNGRTMNYVTMDMTGDGRPDLVVTNDECTPDAQVGATKWLVYPNTGTGFGPAQPFALPPSIDGRYGTKPLARTSEEGHVCSPYDSFSFTTMDLTGDGKPDLLVTNDECSRDLQVGESRWTLYPNTGTGFGVPQAFNLPVDSRYGGRVFRSTTGTDVRCLNQDNRFDFTTLELTGDGKPDLVVTRDTCTGDPAVGQSKWTLFRNDGSGFGAAEPFSFPAALDGRYGSYPLRDMGADDRRCADGSGSGFSFSVMDLTGDQKPDLVVTNDGCLYDLELGVSKWTLFPNTGTGFGAARSFGLPTTMTMKTADGRGGRHLSRTTQTDAACQVLQAKYSYTTMDLTGDGKVDLVMTKDACTDPTVGRTNWVVFPGECGTP